MTDSKKKLLERIDELETLLSLFLCLERLEDLNRNKCMNCRSIFNPDPAPKKFCCRRCKEKFNRRKESYKVKTRLRNKRWYFKKKLMEGGEEKC